MEDDQNITWEEMDRPENWDNECDLISLKCEVMNIGSDENFFNQNFCNHPRARWLKQENLWVLVSQKITMHHIGTCSSIKWK